MNFVWKTDQAEARNIISLIFFRPSSVGNVWWGVVESLMWGQLKSHLFVPAHFVPYHVDQVILKGESQNAGVGKLEKTIFIYNVLPLNEECLNGSGFSLIRL